MAAEKGLEMTQNFVNQRSRILNKKKESIANTRSGWWGVISGEAVIES